MEIICEVLVKEDILSWDSALFIFRSVILKNIAYNNKNTWRTYAYFIFFKSMWGFERKCRLFVIWKWLEKDIKDAVIDYWESQTMYSFKERYNIWKERQKKCGRSDNTIYKYETDYVRFFEGNIIEKMKV